MGGAEEDQGRGRDKQSTQGTPSSRSNLVIDWHLSSSFGEFGVRPETSHEATDRRIDVCGPEKAARAGTR